MKRQFSTRVWDSNKVTLMADPEKQAMVMPEMRALVAQEVTESLKALAAFEVYLTRQTGVSTSGAGWGTLSVRVS